MIPPDRRILPAAQATLIDKRGVATPPMYDFMRRVVEATGLTPDILQQLADLLALIQALQAAIDALDLSKYTKRAANEMISGQWEFLRPILGEDGMPEWPQYSFRADQDTGFYRLGEDNIGFATGGVAHWDINTARVYQDLPHQIEHNDGLRILNPDDNNAGIELTTSFNTLGADNTIGLWEGTGAFRTYGFRFFMDGAPAAEATFTLYRHENSLVGSPVWRLTRTVPGFDVLEQTRSVGGGPTGPSYAFTSDPNTGIYNAAGDQLAFATNGVQRLLITTTGITSTLVVQGPSGSAGAPTYSFSGDPNTGMFRAGADSLGLSAGGAARLTVDTTSISPSVPVLATDGSASAPVYSFASDTNVGMFLASADVVGFVTGGAERVRFGAFGEIGLGGANYGTEGQILTSHGIGAAVTWEDAPAGGGSSLAYVNTTVPAGNTVANTAVETAFASSYDIPASALAVGSVIRIRLFGVVSNSGTPTLRIRIKLDATTVIDTTAITTVSGLSNAGWYTEAQLMVSAIGVGGVMDSQGRVGLPTAVTSTQVVPTPNAMGISVDTTQALTVTATAEWSAADLANTITLRQMAIWIEEAATPIGVAPAAATYTTVNDETASLPNSRRWVNGTNTTVDTSTPGEIKINASGGGGGAMTFVGSAAVAGSAATTLTLSGLNLSADEHYFIVFNFAGATGSTADISLFFNGDTTVTNYEKAVITNSISSIADNAIIGGIIGLDPGRIEGHLELGVTGRPAWIGNSSRISGSNATSQQSALIWDTAANVTSITFSSSIANHLAVGTSVKVWKLTA